MKRTVVVVAVIAALAGAITGGLMSGTGSSQTAQTIDPTGSASNPEYIALKLYPEPRIVADFALTDKTGQPFNLGRWQERWDLVFFGFTHCPDVCPSTLATMREVAQSAGLGDALGVTFISVDPQRDTPSHLAEYVEFFDSDFSAATGPEAQLVALTHQLGVLFDIEPHESGAARYNVDHSAAVLLINPQGRLSGQFPAPHDAEAMSADLKRIVQL
ncbi:MAG: SCO family protein [Lysobacterales bacterium]